MSLFAPAVVVAPCLLVAEASASRLLRLGRYELRDTIANLAVAVGGFLVNGLSRFVAIPISFALYRVRLVGSFTRYGAIGPG